MDADDAGTNRAERIRVRAHAIWEAEGRPDGRHEEHRHRAEREEGAPDTSTAADTAATAAVLTGTAPQPPEGTAALPTGSTPLEAAETEGAGAGAPVR